MKRLLLLVFLLSGLASATTPVTGNVKDFGGGAVGSAANTFARFYLRGCGRNQPRVPSSSSAIAPKAGPSGSFFFDIAANASGVVSSTVYSTRDAAGTGNGEIECGGSYTSVWYGVVFYSNGIPGPETPLHAKNGVTLDLSSATPTSTSPVVVAPTGDSTYARLDAGNTPFSAAISGPSFNGVVNPALYSGADLCAKINTVMAAYMTTGARIKIPAGSYTCATDIVVPNEGSPLYRQPTFILEGDGAGHDTSIVSLTGSVWGQPLGGTQIVWTNTSSLAHISSLGAGYLKLKDITLRDNTTCSTFYFSTNPVVLVFDVEFYGKSYGSLACNDAVVLGGTGSTYDATHTTSNFQGYGSGVFFSSFHRIKRAVLLQNDTNAMPIHFNHVWADSGNLTGGAIEIVPNGAGRNILGGNYTNNLIETVNYKYGIYAYALNGAGGLINAIIGPNGCWDPAVAATYCVYLATGSHYNRVIDGYRSDATDPGFFDADSANDFETSHQNETSIYRQKFKFTNTTLPIQIVDGAGQVALSIKDSSTNDEWQWRHFEGGFPYLLLSQLPAGGASEDLFQFQRTTATRRDFTLLGSADNRIVGLSDLRVMANTGSTLFLGTAANTSAVTVSATAFKPGVDVQFQVDNTNDIGQVGALRPRSAYVGTSLVVNTVSIVSGSATTRNAVRTAFPSVAIGSVYLSTAGKMYLKVANAAADTDWERTTTTAVD
jgi:hypothetical protein